jgi:cell division protein FtsZ
MNVEKLLNDKNFEPLTYRLSSDGGSIIKAIGVGGGGGNAVNNLYEEQVDGAVLVLCNTDDQTLQKSPVSTQILLKTPPFSEIELEKYTCEQQEQIKHYYILSRGQPGYGAGNTPIISQIAAENSLNEIQEILQNNTSMAFVTAGLGGGTGTGAAPVIAEACHKLGILTVGIVTLPFNFEGAEKMLQAWEGVEKMKPFVDALLIILNDKIIEKFPTLKASEFFKVADKVLADAVKGVVDIIANYGYINLDFADVYTTLKGGGGTIMDSGVAAGENRIYNAMENALSSPLLYNFDITKARRVLMAFYSSKDYEFSATEFEEITKFTKRFEEKYKFKWGMYYDDTLGEQAKVTIIATGAENILPYELKQKLNITDKNNDDYDDKSPLKIFDDMEVLIKYQQTAAYERISA